jgi:hypothetical protein
MTDLWFYFGSLMNKGRVVFNTMLDLINCLKAAPANGFIDQ